MYLTEERREDGGSKFAFQLPIGFFTEHELLAAERWRNVYLNYMRSLEDIEMSDAQCEAAKEKYLEGVAILEVEDLTKRYCKRKRVFHAVNAVCVYGEPEELGDRDFILAAAKVGLADLVASNF